MKKFLIILLVLLMLSGCKKVPVNNDPKETENGVSCEGRHYVELMRNYKVGDKKVSADSDNEDFEQFLNDIFSEMITSDFLDMHFLVTDYKAMGLEKPEPKLRSISYSLNTDMLDYYDGILEDLHTFDYQKLSKRQQYDYDILEYYCYSSMAKTCFYRYEFIIGERHNEIEDLASYFTDYTFYDEESVDDYLMLISDIDRFFDDILVYVDDMAKAGYPMTDDWINYTQDICKNFNNRIDNNVLIVTFDRAIDALNFLSEEKKAEVKKQNKELIINEVIPAYKKVAEELEKYRGKAKNEDYALYKLDKDYADYLFMSTSSSNKTIDELFQDISDAYSLLQAEFVSCYYDKEAWQEALNIVGGGNQTFLLEGRDCLEYMRSKIPVCLPDLGEVEYTVEELDPDVAPENVKAYYWPNPIDNFNQNIIRTNPANLRDYIDRYSTLAHEGMTGHMFQSVFYSKTNHNNVRIYLDFIGYTEGWAVYSSYLSFVMAELGYEYLPSVLFYETNNYFLEYSLIDIMTNYYGYNADKIYDYFDENSLLVKERDEIEAIRGFMLEMPCAYTPYGLGYSEMIDLRENVKLKMKDDFDLVDFNESLLINGKMPFNILETYINDRYGIS